MKASDYRQHAQYCRDLAKHTPPGEPREELLEIAETWETLAVERPEWVQQHLELAPGEHQNEDALSGFLSSGRETRTPLVRRELEAQLVAAEPLKGEDGVTSVPQPSSAPPLPF